MLSPLNMEAMAQLKKESKNRKKQLDITFMHDEKQLQHESDVV